MWSMRTASRGGVASNAARVALLREGVRRRVSSGRLRPKRCIAGRLTRSRPHRFSRRQCGIRIGRVSRLTQDLGIVMLMTRVIKGVR